MKKILTITHLFALGLFLFASCDRERIDYGLDDDNAAGNGNGVETFGVLGKPHFSVLSGEGVEIGKTRAASLDDYLVGLYREDGTPIDLIRYGDIGGDGRVLRVGRYRLTVSSHNPQDAEWDMPWYYGETEFVIEENKINDKVKVVCTPHDLEVAVDFEDNLWEILDDDYTVQVEIGEGQLTYTRLQHDQHICGNFYAPGEGDITWYAFFNGTVDGQPTRQQISGTVARDTQKLVITFKLKSADLDLTRGGAAPSVRLDASVTRIGRHHNVTVEEEIIEEEKPEPGPGGEDPQPQGITITGKNYNGSPFDIKSAVTLPSDIPFDSGIPLVIAIDAPAGIRELNVDIVSEKLVPLLSDVELTDHLDLVHPGEFEEKIRNLGFPVKDEVVGKTSIDFSITKFTPLLPAVGAGTHRFVLHVEDNNGATLTETLTVVYPG